MYATYEYYLNVYDGSMSAADYQRYAAQASRHMDAITLDRAQSAPLEMHERLSNCCCELAGQFHRLDRLDSATGNGLLTSAGNDGLSEGYGGYADAVEQCKADIHRTCLRWLTAPVNLMYRGCG